MGEQEDTYKPWWLEADQSELREILFKAAQGFIVNIDPAYVVSKTGDGDLEFTYYNENGTTNKARSFLLVITAAYFQGNNKDEFEQYAQTGFKDSIKASVASNPQIVKKFVESLGGKLSENDSLKNPKKKPN